MKRHTSKFVVLGLVVLAMVLSACGGTTTEAATVKPAESTAVPATLEPTAKPISGSITVLTNRTDLVNDGTMEKYATAFNVLYPDVKVTFEGITDYEGEVQIRMQSTEYGDVLLIPGNTPIKDLPNYFESLGAVADLKDKYNFVESEMNFGGQVYGIAVVGNSQGVLYNKAVWKDAGVTKMPITSDEFLADLDLIKAKGAATPYYTNYKAGWPLSQWESQVLSITCDPDYNGTKMLDIKEPFAQGQPRYTLYKLMYDIVKGGYSEADPTSTDWETSKTLIGTGKVGSMVLGSWAIVQMQAAATAAGSDPANIGYMPFPSNIGGKQCVPAGGDYKMAINKNTKNMDAAKAWLSWFLDKSNFAFDQGGIPPLKGAALPATLADLSGATLISSNPAPTGKESFVSSVDNKSGVGLNTDAWKQRIVDAARGATTETFDAIVADLNAKWSAAWDTVTAGG